MQARKWGRFIVVTSVSVKQPIDGLILSNSIRAGVSGLVKTLANEYGPYNILVNNVCPGLYRHGALAGSLVGAGGEAGRDAEGDRGALGGAGACRAAWASRRSSRTWWCFWPPSGPAT